MEAKNLKTIKTFAGMNSVSTAYIYKLIREGRIDAVIIDDVLFVDVTKFPSLKAIKK